MTEVAAFAAARASYHAALLRSVLRTDKNGIPTNADGSSKPSRKVAVRLMEMLGGETVGARLAGQMSGNKFEDIVWSFLKATFPRAGHLRPGSWEILRVKGRSGTVSRLAKYEQYAHLVDVQRAIRLLTKTDPRLAAALGGDYTISPDVVILRNPEPDDVINAEGVLVNDVVSTRSSLRKVANPLPILHASISCKWTLRSDRAQNARTEALNLMRNRKGRLPHVAVVTGEPLPTRLASLAIGTGDVDCVYHFALNELCAALTELEMDGQDELLRTMVAGKRLKDISDLPLDLAV